MYLEHSEKYYTTIPKAALLGGVILLSIAMAFFISYYTLYLPILILVVASIFILRLTFLAILPFVFIAFVPSDYVPQFRIETAWGLMQPSLVIITIAGFLTFFQKYKHLSFTFPRIVLISFFLFGFSMGFSVLLNGTDLDALMWLSILLLGSGGVYFIAANHNSQRIDGEFLLKIVCGVATIVSILAVIEYLIGYNPFAELYLSNRHWYFKNTLDGNYYGRLVRVISTVGHPLVLSSFILFILPVTLYFAFRAEKKLFWIFSTGIQYLGIFVTFSRSAYLFGGILLLIYLIRFEVISINIKRLIFITVFLALLCIIGFVLLSKFGLISAFLDRISFQTGKDSLLFRLRGWFFAGNFISQDPFFGIGVRQLPIFVRKYLPLFTLTTFDNTFLDLLCEIGIVGLCSYIFFIISPLLSVKNSKHSEFDLFLPLIVFLIMIYFSFLFNLVYRQVIWITYWTLQGLFLMIQRSRPNEMTT
ncbi:MAG: O-antigen ligase family protein [bacterium]